MTKIYYNRRIIRLKDYDYSQGIFFITICTKNREEMLSEIKYVGADEPVRHLTTNAINIKSEQNDNQIIQNILTPIGKIINQKWYEMQRIYDHLKLWKFVIMPDHIYGIIELKNGRTELSAPTQNCSRI